VSSFEVHYFIFETRSTSEMGQMISVMSQLVAKEELQVLEERDAVGVVEIELAQHFQHAAFPVYLDLLIRHRMFFLAFVQSGIEESRGLQAGRGPEIRLFKA
jgi:hypothetical protein